MARNHWEDKFRAALQEGKAGIIVEVHPAERSMISKKKREEVVGYQVKNTAGKMAPILLSKAPKNPLKKERGTKEFSQGYLMGRGKLLDKEFSGKSAWSS